MCGEACEKGLLHSNYECLAFQEVGYKVDSNDANEAVGKVLGEKEKGNGEIFRNIKSYRAHIEGGGFSPYCFISTLRCILMKGKCTNLQNQDYAYFLNTNPLRITERVTLCFIYPYFCQDDWDDVKELRDHNQERYDFNPEAWEEHETSVGKFLTKILKLKVRIS